MFLFFAPPGLEPPPPELPTGGYGAFLFQSLLILVGVCVLAWLVIRFGIKRLIHTTGQANGPLKLVARLSLEPRRTLYVIEAGGKHLLIGTNENGPMTHLGELDSEAITEALAAQAQRPTFLEVLRKKTGFFRPLEPPKPTAPNAKDSTDER